MKLTIYPLKQATFSISSMVLILLLSMTNAMAVQSCDPLMPTYTPPAKFTQHGNGTITDTRTELMWKICYEGETSAGDVAGSPGTSGTCSGIPTAHNVETAFQAATNSTFATHTDWRLPNVKELLSLADYRCFAPTINLTLFPSPSIISAWTSTPTSISYSSTAAFQFAVNTNLGMIESASNRVSSEQDNVHNIVRLVRTLP